MLVFASLLLLLLEANSNLIFLAAARPFKLFRYVRKCVCWGGGEGCVEVYERVCTCLSAFADHSHVTCYNVTPFSACNIENVGVAWDEAIYTLYVCVLIIIYKAHLLSYMYMILCIYRLLRLNHRYYDLLWTLVYLAPKMVTVGIFLVLVYYVYAIIGVEFLDGRVFEGCW